VGCYDCGIDEPRGDLILGHEAIVNSLGFILLISRLLLIAEVLIDLALSIIALLVHLLEADQLFLYYTRNTSLLEMHRLICSSSGI
jgi:hypothetical protein